MKTLKEILIFAGIAILIIFCLSMFNRAVGQDLDTDIVYCGAYWCSGCERMKPIIKELEKTYKVERPEQVDWLKYRVRRIPTTILYRNGVEVKRFTGTVSKPIFESYLKSYLKPVIQQRKIKVVIAGYDDRRFALTIISRVLKKEGIQLVHLGKEDYAKYGIISTPTLIFFEDGIEKYRLECKS